MLWTSPQLCLLPCLENMQKCNCSDSCLQTTNLGHGFTPWLNQMSTLTCWKGNSCPLLSLLPFSPALSPMPRFFWHPFNWKVNCCKFAKQKAKTYKNTDKKSCQFFYWAIFELVEVRRDKYLNMFKQATEAREGRKIHFSSGKPNSSPATLSNHIPILQM